MARSVHSFAILNADRNIHLASFAPSQLISISKPIAEYNTDEYFELDLPVAPAAMVGEEIVVEGSDVSDEKLESVICKHLGLSPPEPKKKGILNRLAGS
ncbi:MAG: hypothetical protein V3S72_05085 [Desulfobacterales bacterium]